MKILALLLFLSFYQVKEYSGKIIHITDGDTFILQTNEGNLTIRLDGIDAPEKKQAFGPESKTFLDSYLYKECKVTYKSLDRYGRTIGVLWVDGVNINLLSVQKGYSWHYKKYSTDKVLAAAENKAQSEKIGLWVDPGAVPPWEWRKLNK
jgi:endonuclease YncB( thermonuclease family)